MKNTQTMDLRQSFREIIDLYRHIPKWERLPKNIEIEDVPVTTRKDIFSASRADCPEKPVFIWNTSGTTGSARFIYYSEDAFEQLVAAGSKYANEVFTSEDIVFNGMLDLVEFSFWKYSNIKTLRVGEFMAEKMPLYTRMIQDKQPTVLLGFFHHLAQILNRCEVIPALRLIYSTGGHVTEQLRALVREKAPRAQLRQIYGASEIGLIAATISEDSPWLRIVADHLYFEVQKKDGTISADGEGALLVTNFFNRSTPLIRFFLGDHVILDKSSSPARIRVLGRSDDWIKLQGDVDPLDELLNDVREIVGDCPFQIVVTRHPQTLADQLLVLLNVQGLQHTQDLKRVLGQYGAWVTFGKLDDAAVRTPRGKIKQWVDKRDTGIPDKTV